MRIFLQNICRFTFIKSFWSRSSSKPFNRYYFKFFLYLCLYIAIRAVPRIGSLAIFTCCIDSEMYFNQIVFLYTDHRFIPAFFILKSLIGFFKLNAVLSSCFISEECSHIFHTRFLNNSLQQHIHTITLWCTRCLRIFLSALSDILDLVS